MALMFIFNCVCTEWNADITKYIYRGHMTTTKKNRTSNPEMLLSKCDITH